MSKVVIYQLSDHPVVSFAATQLREYLGRISNKDVYFDARTKYDPGLPGVWLGTSDAFAGLDNTGDLRDDLDDAIYLRSVGEFQLILAGANPRSVLFAAYAYLETLGCRWIRMGEDGEVLPHSVDVRLDGYDVFERPGYRYRGVCIEGGVSIEHAVALVDYLAKKRFNTYFIQFKNAYMFWSRWYDRHLRDPDVPREVQRRNLTPEQAEAFTNQLVTEIKQRGLTLQMVGHGWTCEALGVPGTGWIRTDSAPPEDTRQLLAEVDGKREWWGGVPINTELCLSNSRAFDLLVDHVVGYAEKRPEIDLLHLWMSDGWNNRCECEACSTKLPSDYYVDVLNAVDRKLREREISTRIVFLAYADLLWAPQESRIESPERFVIMFAPLTRMWRNALLEAPAVPETPVPYSRNKNIFPKSTTVNVHYLRDWKRGFSGDGFVYDYHLLWKHSIVEPTGLFISAILHRDIQQIDDLDLQGLINCQVQRYFFPTGIAMEVSGRTLWDPSLPVKKIQDDYFSSAFGPDGMQVLEKMRIISALMDSDIIFGLEETPSPTYQNNLREAELVLGQLLELCQERVKHASDLPLAQRTSFVYLRYGLDFIGIILKGLVDLAGGKSSGLGTAYKKAGDYLMQHEDTLHTVCDCAMWQEWLYTYAREDENAGPGIPDVTAGAA